MTRAIRWGDDPKLPTWRLVVEDDDGDGLVTIQEELATSTSGRAQTERVLAAVDLREDEARWLHAELGRLLATRGALDALDAPLLPGWQCTSCRAFNGEGEGAPHGVPMLRGRSVSYLTAA